MSVCDLTDVKAIWFKTANGDKVRIEVQIDSLTRLKASELLKTITKNIPQGTNDCGFTVVGGGECRAWW